MWSTIAIFANTIEDIHTIKHEQSCNQISEYQPIQMIVLSYNFLRIVFDFKKKLK